MAETTAKKAAGATDAGKMIDTLVAKARKALDEYLKLDQEQVDSIVHAMALAGLDQHMQLARLAVEETGRGVYEDKIIKNMFATEYIWHDIKHEKTVGVVDENDMEGYVDVAEPVGIVAGVTPVTNPTSTALFKSLICAKTRNPIIFAFHPAAQKCSVAAARVVRDAAVAAGAPENCIQWIENPSIEATTILMNHPGVATILATGGPGMVKSAYSSGKPALGVGPGNVPCYIEKSANLRRACHDLILSKTFDNGMICASEQAVLVDREIAGEFEELMTENGCYFTDKEETAKLSAYAIRPDTMTVNPKIVGQSADWIAGQAGFPVPAGTKILIARLDRIDYDVPLAHEKLSPVLGYFVTDSTEAAFKAALRMLEIGGMGHSAVIHSSDEDLIRRYGDAMKVGRVIANSPSSQGAIGDIYNTNTPSLTLGCGSYGHNSTSSNVSSVNLINKKRLAKRRVNMQWFKVPPKIYFEYDSVQYLEKMPGITRAFIVTDPMMVKLGNVDKVLYYLRRRTEYCHSEIFSEVEPDPSVDTILRGVEAMKVFKPDVIIALGGGSSMDAAKGMWLFYEHPDTDFRGMRLKFMDIRKRAYHFPDDHKVKMVTIPTTSGTGSEVTAFAVITDKQNNIKYPLTDYSLTPDVAIVDPQFVLSMPRSITADTGMDVLTHAIEAYVSVLASDYTDGLALRAIELVFQYLRRAYRDPNDRVARERMHNASCMAGMAFTNAFLGLNHSMAHKLGGDYHIPHGRANAILLPFVIAYNGAPCPTKYASWPKYEYYIAPERYADIARHVGLPAATAEEGVASLVEAIRGMMREMNMPMSIQAAGVDEKTFLSNVDALADKAFSDQCTTANPRLPLVSEIADLYKQAFYGVEKK